MTAQFTDSIIYNDETFRLLCEPLQSYWNDNNPSPDFVPESTALWRGYLAQWQIRDKQLYITSLRGGIQVTKSKTFIPDLYINLIDLFPLADASGIKAEWFSGDLRFTNGHTLIYRHRGYESLFDEEYQLTIQNGNVIKEMLVKHIPIDNKQLQANEDFDE